MSGSINISLTDMDKQDKIKKVMREFKDGKLKTSNSKVNHSWYYINDF